MNPNPVEPSGTRPRLSPRGSVLLALTALATLVGTIYREHLLGRSLFIGNFDRLSSFLNTLQFQADGWKAGSWAAWDDSMFMGRNTFALPFTYPNVLNRFVAALPPQDLYWAAGYISIGLAVLAGWSAFLFLQDVVADRFAAFVGAVLYQFSALAVLKVSQNDMSFAVLIIIPLLLWLVRGLSPSRWVWRFVGICLTLLWLLFFCFLQKAAYALLLLGAYTLFLSLHRRSWQPLAVVTAAGVVAAIGAFPRIYGIVQELGQLQRKISPKFNMQDFAAVYKWQNHHAVDVLRWFSDGLFGRYYGEMMSLKNIINITEGMLLFTGTLVPFLVLAGLVRWRAQWFGLFRPAHREFLFFYAVIAVAMGVLVSQQVYGFFFYLFLRMDFTHSRIIIAALPLICAVAAAQLALIRPAENISAGQKVSLGLLALLTAGTLQWLLAGLLARPGTGAWMLGPTWKNWGSVLEAGVKSLFGHAAAPPAISPEKTLVYLWPGAVQEVLASALVIVVLLGCAWLLRRRAGFQWWAYVTLGALLVFGSWRFANLQVNGPQVHTDRPFADNNSYQAKPGEFTPPTPVEVARLHARLENDEYRSVSYRSTETLPLFTAPHVGAMWRLRQVEGYSSGVPWRLARLPWTDDVLGLRTLTYGGYGEPSDLPWKLLSFLNVKYAIRASPALYKNTPGRGQTDVIDSLEIQASPEPVVPRVFFARAVRVVPDADAAVAATWRQTAAGEISFIDPVAESVLESSAPPPVLTSEGKITAVFAGDTINVEVTPASASRLLVLNELYHPDWQATAGGQSLAVLPANVVMRAVVVPAGIGHLTFTFTPFCRTRNVLLFGAGSLGFAVIFLFALRALLPGAGSRPEPAG